MQLQALITGVNTGIGFATAELLLKSGYKVYGSVRTKEDAQRLQERWGEGFEPLIFDVRDHAAIESAAQHLRGFPLKAIVNNAGIAVSGPLEHVSIERFEKQLAVNVTGLLKVTQAFLPNLKLVSDARIINIGSVSGILATPFAGPYVASKFALEGLTDCLRREMQVYGIKVSLLQPGPIKTAIWNKVLNEENSYEGTAYEPILRSAHKRVERNKQHAMPAEEVARIILSSLNSAKPKLRYLIDKKPLRIRIFRLLPAQFIDKMVLRHFKRKYTQEDLEWPAK